MKRWIIALCLVALAAGPTSAWAGKKEKKSAKNTAAQAEHKEEKKKKEKKEEKKKEAKEDEMPAEEDYEGGMDGESGDY